MTGGGYRASRRYLLASLLASALPFRGLGAEAARCESPGYVGDFDLLWRALDRDYILFDRASRERWKRSRMALRREAACAASPEDLAQVVQSIAAVLRDEQIAVSIRAPRPVRRVPAETDIWAAWQGGVARVEAVRSSSDADVAGLHPGHVVASIDGVPVARAVEAMVRRNASVRDRDWALRRLLAGPWSGAVDLVVREPGGERNMRIERRPPKPSTVPMAAHRMGEARDIGYIRVRDRVWELAPEFRAALAALAGTRALILDLRDVSSSEHSQRLDFLLRPFATASGPWLVRKYPRAKPETNTLSPNGATYTAPIVALVDRWTAGAGEALAAGLNAIAGARLVGTPMAGFGTDLFGMLLHQSGLVLQLPTEKAFHPDGTPLERIRPSVMVDLAAPSGGPGDPILYQALKLLESHSREGGNPAETAGKIGVRP